MHSISVWLIYLGRPGLTSADCNGPCSRGINIFLFTYVSSLFVIYCSSIGYYCPSYLSPMQSLPLSLLPSSSLSHALTLAVIWPEAPQVKSNTYPCGDVTVYCPLGSSYPTVVSAGYYTTGGGKDNLTRYDQVVCQTGSVCERAFDYANNYNKLKYIISIQYINEIYLICLI